MTVCVTTPDPSITVHCEAEGHARATPTGPEAGARSVRGVRVAPVAGSNVSTPRPGSAAATQNALEGHARSTERVGARELHAVQDLAARRVEGERDPALEHGAQGRVWTADPCERPAVELRDGQGPFEARTRGVEDDDRPRGLCCDALRGCGAGCRVESCTAARDHRVGRGGICHPKRDQLCPAVAHARCGRRARQDPLVEGWARERPARSRAAPDCEGRRRSRPRRGCRPRCNARCPGGIHLPGPTDRTVPRAGRSPAARSTVTPPATRPGTPARPAGRREPRQLSRARGVTNMCVSCRAVERAVRGGEVARTGPIAHRVWRTLAGGALSG